MTKKRLSVVKPQDSKLGRPTIMDRALAQRYGTPYVYLAAFAIDVDRVLNQDPEAEGLPAGWEIWLVERYLSRLAQDPSVPDPISLIEETCLGVMELKRDQAIPLGSQLPFAVYTGVARGGLPNRLGTCFHAWKKPPLALLEEIEELVQLPEIGARLVRHCLDTQLSPPLVQPVREALSTLFTEPV